MIIEHELSIKPSKNLTIWRYINLNKFESMLKEKSLFFCRADKFSDPYEGSITKKEAEYRIQEHRSISEKSGAKFNLQRTQNSIRDLSNFHKLFKKKYLINCWHINNTENDSMWQLYLKNNEGIAIRTTVKKLHSAFSNTSEKIFCSKIRYLDYENDIWFDAKNYPTNTYNMFTPLIHKRIEFKQENELRLLYEVEKFTKLDAYWKLQPNQNGQNLSVNLDILIEKVYTAPTSDDIQLTKIRELIRNYGYSFKVSKSKMSKKPYY